MVVVQSIPAERLPLADIVTILLYSLTQIVKVRSFSVVDLGFFVGFPGAFVVVSIGTFVDVVDTGGSGGGEVEGGGIGKAVTLVLVDVIIIIVVVVAAGGGGGGGGGLLVMLVVVVVDASVVVAGASVFVVVVVVGRRQPHSNGNSKVTSVRALKCCKLPPSTV